MTLTGTLQVVPTTDSVGFTFTVENTGTDPVELTFGSGMVADITVADAESGEEVWRWSDGKMFTQALRTQTLAPGETVTHEGQWTNPDPGQYHAEASLATLDVSVTADARFRV